MAFSNALLHTKREFMSQPAKIPEQMCRIWIDEATEVTVVVAAMIR